MKKLFIRIPGSMCWIITILGLVACIILLNVFGNIASKQGEIVYQTNNNSEMMFLIIVGLWSTFILGCIVGFLYRKVCMLQKQLNLLLSNTETILENQENDREVRFKFIEEMREKNGYIHWKNSEGWVE